MARFVLDMTANQKEEKGVIKAKLTLKHEEIVQMIGNSDASVIEFQKEKPGDRKGIDVDTERQGWPRAPDSKLE